MFANMLYEKTSAKYENRLLLWDDDNYIQKAGCATMFKEDGFQVIRYQDDLNFRVKNEVAFKNNADKYVIIAKSGQYVPYDIRTRCREYEIKLAKLFPRLNEAALRDKAVLDLDLLSLAYKNNFTDRRSYAATQDFLRDAVYSRDNIKDYIRKRLNDFQHRVSVARSYRDWILVAELKAKLTALAAEYSIECETGYADDAFLNFVLSDFGKLSTTIDKDSPVLVSKAMEYMHDHSDKFVIIVMDGMSEFDWEILSRSFSDISYEKSNVYAMIPTITSLSRQCLLSNKYPLQLVNPWNQSKEKKEFTECAKSMGFTETQIGYERGYDACFNSSVKCAAVIINDIDDMVHGQLQGRKGMYHDISLLTEEGKLVGLAKRLLKAGFDVYISADHGNTPCTGTGKLMKTGVETETKSHRMLVLKDFADKNKLCAQYQIIDYPKYFLDKQYEYLICGIGNSFDAKGAKVMTHGGITLDEVIVPFVKIKAGENNG